MTKSKYISLAIVMVLASGLHYLFGSRFDSSDQGKITQWYRQKQINDIESAVATHDSQLHQMLLDRASREGISVQELSMEQRIADDMTIEDLESAVGQALLTLFNRLPDGCELHISYDISGYPQESSEDSEAVIERLRTRGYNLLSYEEYRERVDNQSGSAALGRVRILAAMRMPSGFVLAAHFDGGGNDQDYIVYVSEAEWDVAWQPFSGDTAKEFSP